MDLVRSRENAKTRVCGNGVISSLLVILGLDDPRTSQMSNETVTRPLFSRTNRPIDPRPWRPSPDLQSSEQTAAALLGVGHQRAVQSLHEIRLHREHIPCGRMIRDAVGSDGGIRTGIKPRKRRRVGIWS